MDIQISIITITFNAQIALESTLKSVFIQEFQNYEHIIIDGKSSDKTLEVIEKYKRNNLKILSEKDFGISDAFNKGLKIASGNYICFLNAGDIFVNSTILQQISQKLTEKMVTFALDKSNSKFHKKYADVTQHLDIKKRTLINHQVTFVHKSIFDRFGAFNISYKIRMDYDFFLRTLPHTKIIFHNIAIIKYDAGTSGATFNQIRYECEGIIAEYLNLKKSNLYLIKLLYRPIIRFSFEFTKLISKKIYYVCFK